MKTKTDTIIRTVILALALINQVLLALGKNPLPFSEDGVYQVLSALFTAAGALWAWWKNNSFTKNAIRADVYLDQLKEKEQEDEV